MKKTKTALVLQGGGALGAYQGGIYEGLAAAEMPVDWVVGTSIGAINGALIAGNTPENRLSRLREFWHIVGRDAPFALNGNLFDILSHWLKPAQAAAQHLDTLMNGIPGFFKPRAGATFDLQRVTEPGQVGFYDTTPLAETLEKLVDFDYLNSGAVRLCVCAVSVSTGQIVTFDSKHTRLTPQHIMASGALPPGFPPVQIGEDFYWDGGIYSNTPMDVVLQDNGEDNLVCFMIDLWNPKSAHPTSMASAMNRYKDIQYASRSQAHLVDHKKKHDLRLAIKRLSEQLTDKDLEKGANQQYISHASDSSVNVVHITMRGLPGDDQYKDIDFSRRTIAARWAAGQADIARALQKKQWLDPLPDGVGMAIHTLYQAPAPV